MTLEHEHDSGQEAHRDQVADGADDHEGATTDAVDDGQSGHCRDQVHQADGDGHEQGRVVVGTRLLHDLGGVVQDRVDAGELVEHGDEERQGDDLEVAAREELAQGGLRPGGGELVADLLDLFVGLLDGVAEATADGDRFLLVAFGHEPAWRFGNRHQEHEEQHRRDDHHAEHPTPRDLRVVDDLSDDVVRQIGHEDAEDDVELDEADEAAADPRWGDFRCVDRRAHRRQADADAADEAEDHEHQVAGRQGRSEGAEYVQDADEEQQLAAAEAVCGAATDERADDGADGGDGDGGAEAPVVEVELFFERGVGSGDDGGVETEDQAANGGDNGAADDERTRLGGDLCAV